MSDDFWPAVGYNLGAVQSLSLKPFILLTLLTLMSAAYLSHCYNFSPWVACQSAKPQKTEEGKKHISHDQKFIVRAGGGGGDRGDARLFQPRLSVSREESV